MNPPADHQAEPAPQAGAAPARNHPLADGASPQAVLLAVDLGLRSGLAWFDRQGRLLRCRSTHFADRRTLRRSLPGLWQEVPGVTELVLEGGGDLAELWLDSARRRAITAHVVSAEAWRTVLLLPREQRSGAQAKAAAGRLCRKVMQWSGYTRPGQLVHDASEAVLCGLWMTRQLGWLTSWPPPDRRGHG